MTMKKLALLSVACVSILVSCQKRAYKEYKGTWTGTYSGGDHGTWNAEINEEGNIEGTARSDSFPQFSFDLQGVVSKDGNFEAEVSLFFSSATFEGQLKEDKASGTWVNAQDSISGTWSGKKD